MKSSSRLVQSSVYLLAESILLQCDGEAVIRTSMHLDGTGRDRKCAIPYVNISIAPPLELLMKWVSYLEVCGLMEKCCPVCCSLHILSLGIFFIDVSTYILGEVKMTKATVNPR